MSSLAIDDPVLWLAKLYPMLLDRQEEMERLDDFYTGNHPLPFITKAHHAKMRNEFAEMLDQSKSNFMRLVVDAVEERMNIEGFRLSASSSAAADARSWEIWQENQMDSESSVAMIEALVKGVSYLSVWQNDGDTTPTIAVEDPTQTIVGYLPGSNFRKRAAALKVWKDDLSDVLRANVYLPSGIHKFVSKGADEVDAVTTATADEHTFSPVVPAGSKRTDVAGGGSSRRWVELEEEFVSNPVGAVPIIPLRNRPRLRCEGESEIVDVTPQQNQINGFLFLLALAGYFGAHRQRWATGVTLAETEDGQPAELLSAIDTLWQNEDPEGKFGEFSQTDLSGYIAAIDQKVQHIAVTTRTPRHYLLPEGQEPSGDSVKAAESGLTKKITRKQRTFGEAFEEALRLARRFDGEADAGPDSEVIWADPETRSEAEVVDAASKKVSLGLIDRWQALEDIGYTQTQIARMRSEPDPVPPSDPNPQDPHVPA